MPHQRIPYQTTPAKPSVEDQPSPPKTPAQLRKEVDRLNAFILDLETANNFLQERNDRLQAEVGEWKDRYHRCDTELRSRIIHANGGKLF